jgi:glycogen phosphorylase
MNEVEQLVTDWELLTRYGCGPIRFSGRNDALYERHLLFDHVCALEAAGPRERFEAAARSVRDVLSQRWILTTSTYDRENPKRIYYLSMEFLIGRSLSNNITNLLLDPFAKEIAARGKLDPFGLIEQEPDAGLGNGGLGRRGLLSRFHGDDAAPRHGLRVALRVRHVQTVHPGRLAARRAG